jgi:hypothetical protein
MSSESSTDTRRELLSVAGAAGVGAFLVGKAAPAAENGQRTPRAKRRVVDEEEFQDPAEMPRSRRISEEVVVGNSVARSSDYNEAKNHSLIQVIEHVFKEDDDPADGFPVTRVKEFKVKPATKLALITVSGFEFWFGTKDQEIFIASSRCGFHAGLEADFSRGTLTAKVRANWRIWGRGDREWAWRCHVVIQCFGES